MSIRRTSYSSCIGIDIVTYDTDYNCYTYSVALHRIQIISKTASYNKRCEGTVQVQYIPQLSLFLCEILLEFFPRKSSDNMKLCRFPFSVTGVPHKKN